MTKASFYPYVERTKGAADAPPLKAEAAALRQKLAAEADSAKATLEKRAKLDAKREANLAAAKKASLAERVDAARVAKATARRVVSEFDENASARKEAAAAKAKQADAAADAKASERREARRVFARNAFSADVAKAKARVAAVQETWSKRDAKRNYLLVDLSVIKKT